MSDKKEKTNDKIERYKIWAPQGGWSDWAKPVIFADIKDELNVFEGTPKNLKTPDLPWADELPASTAIIVDRYGDEGVSIGMALARQGYRPVPLYNGVRGPERNMAVDVSDIADAINSYTPQLASLSLGADAPPVFLLDERRMRGDAKPRGRYDNRWCVFPQDMPSGAFLLERGIKQIIIRAAYVQNDLSHILRRYQESGIQIVLCSDAKALTPLSVVKPSKFRSLMYRFQTVSGLTRNAAGGFGGQVPEPAQSRSSGVRFYGYG